jgi:hypothetical protein
MKSSPYELCVFYNKCIYNLTITRTPYDAFSIELNSELVTL